MHDKNDSKRERILEADRLYRLGLTLAEVGRRLEPPVSQQMVSKLFAKGVALGFLSKAPHRRRRAGHEVTESDVRAVAAKTGEHRRIAAILRIDLAVLEDRFAHILVEESKSKRAIKSVARRDAIRDAYRDLAAVAGRNPTSSEIPPALAAKIIRHFGTFQKFWSELRVRPDYRKDVREREDD